MALWAPHGNGKHMMYTETLYWCQMAVWKSPHTTNSQKLNENWEQNINWHTKKRHVKKRRKYGKRKQQANKQGKPEVFRRWLSYHFVMKMVYILYKKCFVHNFLDVDLIFRRIWSRLLSLWLWSCWQSVVTILHHWVPKEFPRSITKSSSWSILRRSPGHLFNYGAQGSFVFRDVTWITHRAWNTSCKSHLLSLHHLIKGI